MTKDNKIRQALAELVGADTLVEALQATPEDKRAMLNADE